MGVILTQKHAEKLAEVSEPLIKWLSDMNFDPHVRVIVDNISAELLEGSVRIKNTKYIKD